MRWLLIFSILLLSGMAHAGPLEFLAAQAYRAAGYVKCPEFNSGQAAKYLDQPSCAKSYLSPNQAVIAVAHATVNQAEDEFFKRLAQDSIPQLKCAADFCRSLSKSKESLQVVVDQFQQLKDTSRQYQQWLNDAQKRGYSQCPTTQNALNHTSQLGPGTVWPKNSQAAYRAFCQKGLDLNKAWHAGRTNIYLGQMPSVFSLIRTIVPGSKQPDISVNQIKSAYAKAADALEKEAADFQKRISQNGGQSFDGSYRRALLSDPLLAQQVIAESGKEADLKGLYCDLDSKYGRGAHALDNDLVWGSAGLTLASAGNGLAINALGRVGEVVVGATESAGATAEAIRTAGVISLQMKSEMVLDALTLGTNTVTTLNAIEKNCPGFSPAGSAKGSQCSPMSTLLQIKRGNCAVATVLSAAGIASPLSKYSKYLKGNAD